MLKKCFLNGLVLKLSIMSWRKRKDNVAYSEVDNLSLALHEHLPISVGLDSTRASSTPRSLTKFAISLRLKLSFWLKSAFLEHLS